MKHRGIWLTASVLAVIILLAQIAGASTSEIGASVSAETTTAATVSLPAQASSVGQEKSAAGLAIASAARASNESASERGETETNEVAANAPAAAPMTAPPGRAPAGAAATRITRTRGLQAAPVRRHRLAAANRNAIAQRSCERRGSN